MYIRQSNSIHSTIQPKCRLTAQFNSATSQDPSPLEELRAVAALGRALAGGGPCIEFNHRIECSGRTELNCRIELDI